jgi:hypothetical protein
VRDEPFGARFVGEELGTGDEEEPPTMKPASRFGPMDIAQNRNHVVFVAVEAP